MVLQHLEQQLWVFSAARTGRPRRPTLPTNDLKKEIGRSWVKIIDSVIESFRIEVTSTRAGEMRLGAERRTWRQRARAGKAAKCDAPRGSSRKN